MSASSNKSRPKKPRKVIGIGASAGGITALTDLFSQLNPDNQMAYVVVQHLSPNFESHMPELLARHTKIPVQSVSARVSMEPNVIYLNTTKNHIRVEGNELVPQDLGAKGNLNWPINMLFTDLANTYEENSVGIILSGTGSDGSKGVKEIHARGGTTIIQDPDSADFDGMPIAALQTSKIDHVLPIPEIAHLLDHFPEVKIGPSILQETQPQIKLEFRDILELMKLHSGINFEEYKVGTLARRLEKRMNNRQLKELSAYRQLLEDNVDELNELVQECLINVTEFFRDKEAWKIIEQNVIPDLFARNSSDQPVRVWLAGCATGQEAYSLAILMEEYLANAGQKGLDYKIFASDVDPIALQKAGKGQYRIQELHGVKTNLLSTYFLLAKGTYEVRESIRSRIVFSRHNLLVDPPFVKVNMVICRNVLIYLSSETQKKVLNKFQFALRKDGYLFLGSSENIGKEEPAFNLIDKHWNIFQKKQEGGQVANINWDMHVSSHEGRRQFGVIEPSNMNRPGQDIEEVFLRYLGRAFVPDVLFINEAYKVVYMTGKFVKKLSLKGGKFVNNLQNMLHQETFSIILKGINSLSENGKVRIEEVPFHEGDELMIVDMEIREVNEAGLDEIYYLIRILDENKSELPQLLAGLDESVAERISHLEDSLVQARKDVQFYKEQLESVNEEIMSTNEELMASNEELQSANQELESLNEELYMVNNELQNKNTELLKLNNDIRNLLDSSDVGTLFLDEELKIRLFTPSLQRNFMVEDHDVGRSIRSFASSFSEEVRRHILQLCESAMDQISTFEEEVRNEDKIFFYMKVKPYITRDRQVKGVILNFLDIDDLKRTQGKLEEKNQLFELANEITETAVWEWDIINDVTYSKNKYWDEYFGLNQEGAGDQFFNCLSQEDSKAVSAAIHGAMNDPNNPTYRNIYQMTNPKTGVKRWLKNTGMVIFEEGKAYKIIGVTADITNEKQLTVELERKGRFYQSVTDSHTSGLYIFNFVKGINTYVNVQYTNLLGYTMEEINALGQEAFMELFHPDDRQAVLNHMNEVVSGKSEVAIEYRFKRKDGEWIVLYSVDSPFEYDQDGKVISFIGSFIHLGDKE